MSIKKSLPAYMVALVLISCKERLDLSQIAGIYTREYTFDYKFTDTSRMSGEATIRDTIFIKARADKYIISNHRWLRNSGDQRWTNLKHSFNSPRSTYWAHFDQSNNLLISYGNIYPPIIIDILSRKLFVNNVKKEPYLKIVEK